MIDLHSHTTASDGVVEPDELPLLAERQGLTAIAITDHDTVDGVEAFLSAGTITKVPGIELSTRQEEGKCHIVGLFIDHTNDALRDALVQLRSWRDERNVQIIAKLNEMGIAITLDEVLAYADGTVGRPHIAAVLVDHGICGSTQEAFKKYLGDAAPAYVGKKTLSPADAIALIHAAGGIAIWAHPFARASMTNAKFGRMLDVLQASGLDGVEAYYPEHTISKKMVVLEETKKRGLLVSGGSDFHGGDRHIGILPGTFANGAPLEIPDSILDDLSTKYTKYTKNNE